ncbi:MAG: GTP-binding protein [Oscillospiraceae bacterium]|nr:GTP-binding protein [Oscillospiraceae bacterium]
MTKVDIISGFLGAGKTTLIKKLLDQVFSGEKLVLIENEFGEVSVDGGFLQQAGIQVSELSSGCICCTLVGDFTQALGQVYDQYKPDRILIEPSGVAKLSDVIAAVEDAVKAVPELELNSFVTVVDSTKAKSYMKNIPEFYNNQIQSAGSILLSRTQKLTQEKLEAVVALLREQNPSAVILTTPWDQLDGKVILSAIEGTAMSDQLKELVEEAHEHQHEHDHHAHDDEDAEAEHHHHEHHPHDHEDGAGHDHHHHDHGPNCTCGCHDHDHQGHHHHHDADERFTSWGKESPKPFSQADIDAILTALDSGEYGEVFRAKGIVPDGAGGWLEFDYVPGEKEIRPGRPDYTGRLCVIGGKLDEEKLGRLFGL